MSLICRAATSLHRASLQVCLAAAVAVQGCALPGMPWSDREQTRRTALHKNFDDAPEGAVSSASVGSAGVRELTTSADPGSDQVTVQVSASPAEQPSRRSGNATGSTSVRQPITTASWNPIPYLSTEDNETGPPRLLDPGSGQPLVMRRIRNDAARLAPAPITEPRLSQASGVTHANYEETAPPEILAPPEAAPQALPAGQPKLTQRALPLPFPPGTPPPPQPEPAPGSTPPLPNNRDKVPAGDGSVHIPLQGSDPGDNINLVTRNGRVSLVVRNAPVQSVLNLLAQQQGVNLIAADDVIGNISVTLTNVAFEDALGSIVAIAGCTWTQQKGIVLVTKIGGNSKGLPGVQGKIVQVFPLNFVSATDIEATIKGLLSPVGQVFISQTTPKDQRRTQELVVIEDLPDSVARAAQYLAQIDQPPRQVVIEAHILQVDLKDDTRHGVDWNYITTAAGRDIALKTAGFANPLATPATIFSLSGDHLKLVIEALKTTVDAKTLASPRITVANGQEARIQIGSKLGYFVTTTTQTATMQNVNFLNTGVVMRVMPQISNDGRVLLQVKPEVSTGKISSLGLPETNTTEAETTLLLEDGSGMVIGGLIKESDSDTQDKVPILGDLWAVGRLFQHRVISRQRSEIIVMLVPRITPFCKPEDRIREAVDITRTQIPIFKNGLQPINRSFEPRLPDAINNPRRFRAERLPALLNDPRYNNPKPLRYYFPTFDEEMTPDEAIVPPGSVAPAVLPPPPDMPPGDDMIIEKTLPTGAVIRLRRPAGSQVRNASHAAPAGTVPN